MSENRAKGLVFSGDLSRGELKSCLIIWSRLVLLLLGGLCGSAAAEFQPGERLDYTFSYRGVFSGFVEINIAHASFTLAAQPVSIDGHPAYRADCQVTTKPFAEAEMIYPFRYRYLSWFESKRQMPYLALESLQSDEVEEELLWFDRQRGLGFRYHKSQLPPAPEARPPALPLPGLDLDPQEWSLADGAHRQPLPKTGVWDYLSMLYRLRFGELSADEAFDLPVYNGKQIKTYRIEVTRSRFIRGGWNLPAFKMNLFEVRNDARKDEKITTVWISDDAARRPLLFHVERVFGVFEGMLETDRPSSTGVMNVPHPATTPTS